MEQLENAENLISQLSVITEECMEMLRDDYEGEDEMKKQVYINQECIEINESLSELIGKIENIKNMLLMDKMSPGVVDYTSVIDQKISENRINAQFFEMFGPYMALFNTLS